MQHKAAKCMALLIVCLVPLLPACRGTAGISLGPTEAMRTPTAALASIPEATAAPTPTTPPVPSPFPTAEAYPTPSPLPSLTPMPSPPPTPSPSLTAEPSATLAPPDEVVVRETTISILYYPYEPDLHEAFDAQHAVPYLWLDRAAYTAHGEPPAEALVLKYFSAIVLENRYLQLTVLPELGGRVYECVFKPTGQNIFYRNQVLKPTPWGPLTREQNWWLAAGGMEWAFPVHEHGYEWGLPWSYSIKRSTAETTVTLWDTAEDRPRMSVEVALAPGEAYFAVRPRIENPTSSAITYQYWTNAMLTLGSPSMSPNTEFVYPTQEVTIHSAGPDSGLPGERASMSWPLYEGLDMAWYHNWVDWLGFFIPQPTEDFVGAYNHDTGLGVARIFPRQEVPGVKLFAWGQESPHTFDYTDDGSQYFEIWGGPNRTFWPEDDNSLGSGEDKAWSEYWYPFYQIGGLDFANREAALSLEAQQGVLMLGLATTSYQQGTVLLMLGEEELYREEVAVSPDSPHTRQVPLPPEVPATAHVSLRFLGPDGQTIAQYDEHILFP